MEGKGGQKLKVKVYSQGVRVIEDGGDIIHSFTHSLTHSLDNQGGFGKSGKKAGWESTEIMLERTREEENSPVLLRLGKDMVSKQERQEYECPRILLRDQRWTSSNIEL